MEAHTPRSCPAYGKICNSGGKNYYFAKCCKAELAKEKMELTCMENSEELARMEKLKVIKKINEPGEFTFYCAQEKWSFENMS